MTKKMNLLEGLATMAQEQMNEAQTAAAKAKTGAELMTAAHRLHEASRKAKEAALLAETLANRKAEMAER